MSLEEAVSKIVAKMKARIIKNLDDFDLDAPLVEEQDTQFKGVLGELVKQKEKGLRESTLQKISDMLDYELNIEAKPVDNIISFEKVPSNTSTKSVPKPSPKSVPKPSPKPVAKTPDEKLKEGLAEAGKEMREALREIKKQKEEEEPEVPDGSDTSNSDICDDEEEEEEETASTCNSCVSDTSNFTNRSKPQHYKKKFDLGQCSCRPNCKHHKCRCKVHRPQSC